MKFSLDTITNRYCWQIVLLTCLLFCFPYGGNAQSVIINEVMASNATTIADEDGAYADWIELHNTGEEAVNLEGYGLSDSYDDPFRWKFPGVTIEAGGYLLVWASGKNRRDPNSPLHTIFSISSAGEEVLLSEPGGTIVDELPPTMILTDVSVGRTPGDLSDWYFFDESTPGGENATFAWSGIQEPPSFSHQAGFYDAPFVLSLSADENVRIYYTLDGSVPDPSNTGGSAYVYKNQYPMQPGDPEGPFLERAFITHLYDSPVPVQNLSGTDGIHRINTSFTREPLAPRLEVMKGVVVRARAYREGYLPGPVTTHTYLVGESISDRFDLPVVSITIPDSSLFDYSRGIYVAGKAFDNWRLDNPDEPIWPAAPANWGYRGDGWERCMHMEMFDQSGKLLMGQNLGVRIHGGWSRSNPKKSLRLYARNIYDVENEISHVFFPGQNRMLGDRETETFKRLMLRAGGNGNRILRDVVAHDLMQHLQIGVQRAEPAVHFINGVYWGLVNIRDRQDRYHIAYEYDICPDNVIILNAPHDVAGMRELEEGDRTDLAYFNDLYRFVTRNNMADDVLFDEAAQQMDMDSYIDYYLAFIYLANSDWGGRDNVGAKHFRFWRVRDTSYKPYQDGKWRMMVWDFDNGFSDYNYDLLTDVFDPENEPSAMIISLIENQWFRNRFINRLADLMNSHFLPGHALSVIDRRLQNVINEAAHDLDRWRRNALGDVPHIQQFVTERPVRQRQEVQEVFQLPGKSEVNLRTNRSGGHIRINTIGITSDLPGVEDPGNWTGTYFHDVPVEIEAVPGPGMVFSHWEGLPEGTPARTTITLDKDTALTAHFWDGIIHYWHFNYLPDDDLVETVNADYSLFPDDARIVYPGTGEGYMDRVSPGTELNAHMGVDKGYGLRVRNPSDTRSLVFHVPASGHYRLGFSYAVHRTNNGARRHHVEFSADHGVSWERVASDLKVMTGYAIHTVDLSPHAETDNNPDLQLRILFTGDEAGNSSGNNRFDNIVVREDPLSLNKANPPGGTVNEPYAYELSAMNGKLPYVFEIVDGTLPPGLHMSADGAITGTPLHEGTYFFEVEATDDKRAYARQEYTLSVYGGSLIHYWHFNDLPCVLPDTVYSDYSATAEPGYITYYGSGEGYMDVAPGDALNSWSDVPGGSGLRVRNPSNVRELRMATPSDGFDYLELSYAVHRTNNGARWQLLQYSPDNGKTWISIDSPFRITSDYQVTRFDVRRFGDTADNAQLMFRILFMGPESANTSGNNRFDNVALRGIVLPGFVETNELFVHPNPVTEGVVYLIEKMDIRVFDTFGRLVYEQPDTKKVTLPDDMASGVYLIVAHDGRHAKIFVP